MIGIVEALPRMEERYLKVQEVADRLGVTRQAVHNWINEGRLRAVKAGRALRIPESAIMEFLKPVQPGKNHPEDDEHGNA
jgi:excisionase family DNA binding protein